MLSPVTLPCPGAAIAAAARATLPVLSTERLMLRAPDNIASQALVARVGAVQTGTLNGALVFDYPLGGGMA